MGLRHRIERLERTLTSTTRTIADWYAEATDEEIAAQLDTLEKRFGFGPLGKSWREMTPAEAKENARLLRLEWDKEP